MSSDTLNGFSTSSPYTPPLVHSKFGQYPKEDSTTTEKKSINVHHNVMLLLGPTHSNSRNF